MNEIKEPALREGSKQLPELFRGRIPIIILNWEGTTDTLKCLTALMEQWTADFFIYLMDNGSSDSEFEALKEGIQGLEQIHFVGFKSNLGFVGAHNYAFEQLKNQSSAPGYILLNNDAFPEANFLTELLRQIELRSNRLVACKMIQFFNPQLMDNSGHFMLNTAEIMPMGSSEPIERWDASGVNVGPCAGACYYPKEMLDTLGGFDDFFATGYEDAELGLRATVTGYECIYWPRAAVRHKMSTSINKVKDFDYVRKTQINIFYTWWKLMPPMVLLINLPFVVLKYALVLLMDVLTFRWKMLRVTWSAIKACLGSERKQIAQARSDFQSNNKTISSWNMLCKQRFFLFVDLKRFYNFYIKGERTYFEAFDDQRSKEA